jgi:hypothetical protein
VYIGVNDPSRLRLQSPQSLCFLEFCYNEPEVKVMTIQQERSLLDKLLHSPRLPIYGQEIQAVLADEAQKRQRFYAQITEQDKAELSSSTHCKIRLMSC